MPAESPAARAHLRWTGRLEGASFLLLLLVAMPLKHLAGLPTMVRIVGLVHGLLFTFYVLALIRIAGEERWSWRLSAAGVVAAFLPFGPFWFERRLPGRGAGPIPRSVAHGLDR